jgi:hypothetical protein
MIPHHNTVDVQQRAYSKLQEEKLLLKNVLDTWREETLFFCMSSSESRGSSFCFILYNNARYLHDEDYGNEEDNISHEKEWTL